MKVGTEILIQKLISRLNSYEPARDKFVVGLMPRVKLFETIIKIAFVYLAPFYVVVGGLLLYALLSTLGLTQLFPVLLSNSGLFIAMLVVAMSFPLTLIVVFSMPALTGLMAWQLFPRHWKNKSPTLPGKYLAIADSYDYFVGAVLLVIVLLLSVCYQISDTVQLVSWLLFLSVAAVGIFRYWSIVPKTEREIVTGILYGFVYAFSMATIMLTLGVLALGIGGDWRRVALVTGIGIFLLLANQELVNRYSPYPRKPIGKSSDVGSLRTTAITFVVATFGFLLFSAFSSHWIVQSGKKLGLIGQYPEDRIMRHSDYSRELLEKAGFSVGKIHDGYYPIETNRIFSFAGLEVLCPTWPETAENHQCLIIEPNQRILRFIKRPTAREQ